MSEERKITDVIKALNKAGITKLEITYSGGGDDGSFEEVNFFKQETEGTVAKLTKTVPCTVDWTKVLNLSDDEDYSDEDFLGSVYGDQGRLNQWYSFAGEYSCNGTITVNTETGEYDDDGYHTTEEPNNNSGNIYKDPCRDIFGKDVA